MKIEKFESTRTVSVTDETRNNLTESLSPGQLDRARELLTDDLYGEVEEFWSEEVVREFMKEQELREEEGKPTVDDLKDQVIREINKACEAAIYSGVDIPTSEGTKHFNLSDLDQANITGIIAASGSPALMRLAGIDPEQGIWYKADGPGETHHFWKTGDIMALAAALFRKKSEQMTYCEHIKNHIKTLTTADEINSVWYGMELPAPEAQEGGE